MHRIRELHRLGTQTVFGEGAKASEIMFVGEQPGDQEDLAGKPFVGPAGRVLDEAIVEAGIRSWAGLCDERVKHFKWQTRGKRRIHQKPNAFEQAACRPWLEAELEVVKPHVLVLLGATAAQSLLGSSFRVTKMRSVPVDIGPRAERDRDGASVFDPPRSGRAGKTSGDAGLRRRPEGRREAPTTLKLARPEARPDRSSARGMRTARRRMPPQLR